MDEVIQKPGHVLYTLYSPKKTP